MKEDFEVSINDKVVKLKGEFVGNSFCVDSSSIDNHSALTPDEKERLKRYFRSDNSLQII